MVLITFVQLDEIAAPAPYTHDEVAMPLGMLLRVQQFLETDGVELKLMSAENDEGADKLSELHHSLVALRKMLWSNSKVSGPPFITRSRFGFANDLMTESGPFSRMNREGE